MSTLQKLKKLFARGNINQESKPKDVNQANQNDGRYREELELLCDRAKDLCPNPWLSNQIRVSASQKNGAYSFNASPKEGLPYVRAANYILKDRLSLELSKYFDAP